VTVLDRIASSTVAEHALALSEAAERLRRAACRDGDAQAIIAANHVIFTMRELASRDVHVEVAAADASDERLAAGVEPASSDAPRAVNPRAGARLDISLVGRGKNS
jgi:hypothetical protein